MPQRSQYEANRNAPDRDTRDRRRKETALSQCPLVDVEPAAQELADMAPARQRTSGEVVQRRCRKIRGRHDDGSPDDLGANHPDEGEVATSQEHRAERDDDPAGEHQDARHRMPAGNAARFTVAQEPKPSHRDQKEDHETERKKRENKVGNGAGDRAQADDAGKIRQHAPDHHDERRQDGERSQGRGIAVADGQETR
ncbi:hypothetical protein [Mangrovicella endophytica]|uniref:hypothetical protein n=1 Tax=Mangrovicella endophytica TaxID=2066697 RepID=UPI0012FFFE36|nr:hypothetical protein [Mangrovicella endophytica]